MTTIDPAAIIEALRHLTADPEALQERIQGAVTSVQREGFVGTALHGQVTATVSGLGALRSIEISTMAKRSTDNLTLGDAVTEAVRNAEKSARSALVDRILREAVDKRYAVLLDPERLGSFLPH
jgi:DNA-binding protein YbaB